jgi:hypothetical protein
LKIFKKEKGNRNEHIGMMCFEGKAWEDIGRWEEY